MVGNLIYILATEQRRPSHREDLLMLFKKVKPTIRRFELSSTFLRWQ